MIVRQFETIGDNYCQLIYLHKVFKKLAQHLSDEYQVILTDSSDANLQDYDGARKNIVVFIGDEKGLVPRWHSKPQVIFRAYNRQGLCDYTKIFPIPCGFNGPIALDGVKNEYFGEEDKKPLLGREYDLFYSGQRSFHRSRFIRNVNKIKGRYKSVIEETNGFRQGFTIKAYFEYLNNTKIALVPDGRSIPESFRYVEAFESNCVVITSYPIKNNQYRLWYYETSPAIFLDKWSELTSALVDRALDEQFLVDYFEQSKHYYDTRLSTTAVANYMLDKITF